MNAQERTRSALVGLLLVVSIVVTACAALSSPDGLLQSSPPAAEADGSSSGGLFGGGECSEPGSAGGGAPDASIDPAPACDPGDGDDGVVDDPDAVVTSPPMDPTDPSVDDPRSTFVEPKPGVIDPRPVFVQAVSASVEDGHVIAMLEWVSGVEPCYTLAEVRIERDGAAFILTPMEGPTSLDVACIEIAMYKATRVDLGALPAGTYEIRVGEGEAAPVEVTVP